MGEGEEKKLQASSFLFSQRDNDLAEHKDEWVMIMEGDLDDGISNASTSLDDNSSSTTNGSICSSLDVVDDDATSPPPPPSSSSSSSSSSNSNSPFELSELMNHLPIKRGLSKYYEGKSQSFTSLSRVVSIEDLPKKEIPYRRKIIKASKSYGNGLDAHKQYTLPKPIISKKASRSCLSSPSFPSRRGNSFSNSSRPPTTPSVQKKV